MKIVLAVDLHGGEESAEALVDEAVEWARRLRATLDLVWVDPLGSWKPFTLDRKVAEPLEREVEKARQRDRDRLQALLGRVPVAHRGAFRALSGEPARCIVEAAQGYDALLLGPGGQLGDKLGLESLESAVVRHAPCPVIVLRPPAR